MKPILPVRLLISALATVATAAALILLLLLTDTALSVWQRMQETPLWFLLTWPVVIALLAALAGWKAWRLLTPAPRRPKRPDQPPPAADEQSVRASLQTTEVLGVDTEPAEQELQELDRRRRAGVIHVALFGEISSGKSSLIKALLPETEVDTGPQGGTTREVAHYSWHSSAGDRLIVDDVPGLNQAGGSLDDLAYAEATRAQVVVYVCEGDLTRSQANQISALRKLEKPMIVALNKTDRYSEQELAALQDRLRRRLGPQMEIVAVVAGGTRTLTVEHPDGSLGSREQPRAVDVRALASALQAVLDRDPAVLDQLRDAAVFHLVSRQLDEATREFRLREATLIVRAHARKAMLGSLAAVGPGTDVVVQGYLGVSMLKELTGLYGISPREMDLSRFLDLAARHVDHRLSILLAISGNVLKAFPGLGTVTGGLTHAVAYGLIFDSLGRAAARALDSRGRLSPNLTLKLFEDSLGENLESRARRLAGIVLSKEAPGDGARDTTGGR